MEFLEHLFVFIRYYLYSFKFDLINIRIFQEYLFFKKIFLYGSWLLLIILSIFPLVNIYYGFKKHQYISYVSILLTLPSAFLIFSLKSHHEDVLIEVAYLNYTNLFIFLMLFYLYAKVYLLNNTIEGKFYILKWTACFLVSLSLISRLIYKYNYDSIFTILFYFGDFIVIGVVLTQCFQWLYSFKSFYDNLMKNLCFIIIIMLVLITTGIQRFIGPSNFFCIHIIMSVLCIRYIIKIPFKHFDEIITKFSNIEKYIKLSFIILLFPIILYLFYPGVPDADIISVSEFIGFLLQGKFLFSAPTGYFNEIFQIRYPAGIASLGYFICAILNLRGSDGLFITWILCYIVFILSIFYFSKKIKISPFWPLLFIVCNATLSARGFTGGQLQEMLAYTLCLYSLMVFLDDSKEKGLNFPLLISSIFFSAAFVTQPMVAIVFCLPLLYAFLHHIKFKFKNLFTYYFLIALCPLVLTIIYYYFTVFGATNSPAIPMSNDMSSFLYNVFYMLTNFYTITWPLFFVFIYIAIIGKNGYWKYGQAVIFISWGLNAIIVDGLFNKGSSYGSFSIIALLAIGAGLLSDLVKQNITLSQTMKLGINILLGLLWIINSFLQDFPMNIMNYTAKGPYTTHADIKLGRMIEKIVPYDAFILNIVDPGVSLLFALPARGNFSRNTVYRRLGGHQLKNGDGDSHGISVGTCTEENAYIIKKYLQSYNITHIFISSQKNISNKYHCFGNPKLKFQNSILIEI